MNQRIDISGQRFGHLTAVTFVGGGKAHWLCRCDCGVEKTVAGHHLRGGKIASCGCQQSVPGRNVTHGMSKSPLYLVWSQMISRCENPKDESYPRYGGRGISVCDRWHSFENFLADMGMRPSASHQIERRENSGNYEPGNCKWATVKENQRNKRSNRTIDTPDGQMLLIEASEKYGIGVSTIRWRINAGWSVANVFRSVSP